MTIPLKLENKYLDERGKINLDFPMEVLSSKLKENLRDTYENVYGKISMDQKVGI